MKNKKTKFRSDRNLVLLDKSCQLISEIFTDQSARTKSSCFFSRLARATLIFNGSPKLNF